MGRGWPTPAAAETFPSTSAEVVAGAAAARPHGEAAGRSPAVRRRACSYESRAPRRCYVRAASCAGEVSRQAAGPPAGPWRTHGFVVPPVRGEGRRRRPRRGRPRRDDARWRRPRPPPPTSSSPSTSRGRATTRRSRSTTAPGAAVDLAAGGYNVQMFFNGRATAGLTIDLTGTVAAGDVFVLAQTLGANAAILAPGRPDQRRRLVQRRRRRGAAQGGRRSSTSIGQVGVDPGTEWGTGLDEHRRQHPAPQGRPSAPGDTDRLERLRPGPSSGTASRMDAFDGLGAHTAACGSTSPPTVASVTSAVPGTDDAPGSVSPTVTFSEAGHHERRARSRCSCSVSGAVRRSRSAGAAPRPLDPTTDLVDGDGCTAHRHRRRRQRRRHQSTRRTPGGRRHLVLHRRRLLHGRRTPIYEHPGLGRHGGDHRHRSPPGASSSATTRVPSPSAARLLPPGPGR